MQCTVYPPTFSFNENPISVSTHSTHDAPHWPPCCWAAYSMKVGLRHINNALIVQRRPPTIYNVSYCCFSLLYVSYVSQLQSIRAFDWSIDWLTDWLNTREWREVTYHEINVKLFMVDEETDKRLEPLLLPTSLPAQTSHFVPYIKKITGHIYLLTVTNHWAMEHHLSYDITPDTGEHACPNPNEASSYSICLAQMDGRLSWTRWLVTYRDGLPILVVTTW